MSKLKQIRLFDEILQKEHSYKIICQNLNGPCPLIAICNVLILRGEVTLPEPWTEVASDYLVSIIGELLLNKIPSSPKKEKQSTFNCSEDSEDPEIEVSREEKGKAKRDLDAPVAMVLVTDDQKNIEDLLPVIPRLLTGLDVNVRFDSVFSFEVQPELLIFDLFNIRLCHAWIPPPNELEIKSLSYNGLTDVIIKGHEAAQHLHNDEAKLQYELGLRCSEFLETSASQLTIDGLMDLKDKLQPSAIVVFFRNNHFSVLHKHESQLLILVTDQGYAQHGNIVWETLDEISGNSQFLDGYLKQVSLTSASVPEPTAIPKHAKVSVDDDYALALQLQDQLNIEAEQEDEQSNREPDFIDKVSDKCTIQ